MVPAFAQTQTKDQTSQATPQSETLQKVESPREPGNFHEGTSFKIGPVTDDAKLIKPVAGEDNGSVTTRSNPAPEKNAAKKKLVCEMSVSPTKSIASSVLSLEA